MCNAQMRDGRYEPFMKDGQPIEGTVKISTSMMGRRHLARDDAARKLFFREHPAERSVCYPE